MSQFFTSLEQDELEKMIRRIIRDEITRISTKEEPEELIKANPLRYVFLPFDSLQYLHMLINSF